MYRATRAALSLVKPSLVRDHEVTTGFKIQLTQARELQTQARERQVCARRGDSNGEVEMSLVVRAEQAMSYPISLVGPEGVPRGAR